MDEEKIEKTEKTQWGHDCKMAGLLHNQMIEFIFPSV